MKKLMILTTLALMLFGVKFNVEAGVLEDSVIYDCEDTSIKEDVDNYLEMIPEAIKNDFINEGWKVIVTDKNLQTYYANDGYVFKNHICGLAYNRTKEIIIGATKFDTEYAVIHEFGHFIDYDNEIVSVNDNFEQIFNAECNNLANVVYSGNRKSCCRASLMEYFAEAYNAYVTCPELLMEYCPLTYGYIGAVVETY